MVTSDYGRFWQMYYSYPKVEYNGTRTIHYRETQNGGYRVFSNRVGPFQYQPPTISELKNNNNYSLNNPLRRHDYGYYTDYKLPTQPYREIIEQFKATHPDLYPRYANTIESGTLVVRNGNSVKISLTKDNPYPYQQANLPQLKISLREKDNEFISEMKQLQSQQAYFPQKQKKQNTFDFDAYSFTPQEDENFYVSKNSTLSFHVIREPACQSNFEPCAINLGKAFKDNENLVQVSQLLRDLRWKKQISSPVRFLTFTEAFHANIGDQKNVYFIFNALDPSDGSVIRIEAKADAWETKRDAGIMLSIFDTFTFY